MGRARTIARRTFLIGSAAIVGGVAFGTYAVRKPFDNPLLNGLEPDAAAFNPWVMIDREKITLIAPHTDLGQGAQSMQVALIAEEMDLEFGQFEVSNGVPSPAYFNTALGAGMAPFMETDQGFGAQTVRSAAGAIVKLMGVQATGGSSSVPDSYTKLRMAGAVARETLKRAASVVSGVPVDALKTSNGAVHLPDGSVLRYVDLSATAATLEPVTDVKLRDPSTWRMVGKPMQRTDIVAKSTGTQDYGIDLFFDGMLNATVKTNPRQGGVMNGFDAQTAKTMPGVHAILPVTNGVAVVASNTWYAIEAANAIDFDWGPAPYPAEQDQHWAEVEKSFVNDRLDKEWRADGDVDAALTGAEVIDAEYRAPYVAHQPLEPIGAVAKVTDDRVDIWVSHQLPRDAVDKVAATTGHDTAHIHLHNLFAGGSFGHRLEFGNVTYAAEIANQMRGTHVKLTFSREEDFAHDFPRQIGMARGKGAIKDGQVVSCDLQIATVSASRSQIARLGQNVPGPDKQICRGRGICPIAFRTFGCAAMRCRNLRRRRLGARWARQPVGFSRTVSLMN